MAAAPVTSHLPQALGGGEDPDLLRRPGRGGLGHRERVGAARGDGLDPNRERPRPHLNAKGAVAVEARGQIAGHGHGPAPGEQRAPEDHLPRLARRRRRGAASL